ncbi:MAG: cell division protein FtsQ/DivIB [Gammaproteobacteria bacterium]
MRADAAVAGTAPGTANVQGSVLRLLGWCIAVLLIAAALLPLVPRLGSPATALTLEIGGDLDRVPAEAVRALVAPRLDADFYELDLGAVRAAVETLPWVATARVERAWPATVRVHVQEHRAIARWGGKALLSDRDAVFTPPAIPDDLAGLPRLAGPAGQQGAVREAYAGLVAQLADTPFVPVALEQNARGEWAARTGQDIELRLGRGAPLAAVSLLAGPVRTALEGRLQEVTYVDLHYINGFAVGWRESVSDGAGRVGAAATGGDD